jgi:tRNA threonylcarbamoyladenosine biosynthesis protein TsaB
MLTLGLDTSEALGGVALCRDGALLVEVALVEPLRHAEALLPAVERLLSECGVEKKAIELVCVNRGPGSFTGLRIGLATAKGLCQALEIPLVGVDGTMALRARLGAGGAVCAVVPCRLDLVYACWYLPRRKASPIHVTSRSALLERISSEAKPLWIVGSAAEPMRQDLEKMPWVKVAAAGMNRPSPEWVARLGEEAYREDELYRLEPAYVDRVMGEA